MAKFASKKEIREGIGYESLISHGGLRRFAALPLLSQPSLQTTVE
jgi:hypothetical protein